MILRCWAGWKWKMKGCEGWTRELKL
jgi:hypothetical protein